MLRALSVEFHLFSPATGGAEAAEHRDRVDLARDERAHAARDVDDGNLREVLAVAAVVGAVHHGDAEERAS